MRTVINSSNLPLAFIRLPLYPSIFSSYTDAPAVAPLPSTFHCRRCQQMMEALVHLSSDINSFSLFDVIFFCVGPAL